ncbi:hypothetical protein [Aeromonas jandaei]
MQHQTQSGDGGLQIGGHLVDDGLADCGDFQHKQQDGTDQKQDQDYPAQ